MSSPVLLRHLCVLVEGNCNWFQFAQMTEPSPRRGHTSPGKVRDDGIDGQQRSLSDKKLQIVPVIAETMKKLEIPGIGKAFTLCDGAQVAPGKAIRTACTPMLLLTGETNDNPDLNKVIAEVKPADFTPQVPAFASFWKSMTKMGADTWDSTVAGTKQLVTTVGDKF